MNTAESLRFSDAKFKFFDAIVEEVYLREQAETYPLTMVVECWPLDLQVFSLTYIEIAYPRVPGGGASRS